MFRREKCQGRKKGEESKLCNRSQMLEWFLFPSSFIDFSLSGFTAQTWQVLHVCTSFTCSVFINKSFRTWRQNLGKNYHSCITHRQVTWDSARTHTVLPRSGEKHPCTLMTSLWLNDVCNSWVMLVVRELVIAQDAAHKRERRCEMSLAFPFCSLVWRDEINPRR